MTLYCSADGAGPRECPDWPALYKAAGVGVPAGDALDAAHAPIDNMRAAEPGHLAANGNGPRTSTLTCRQVAELLPVVGVEHGSAVDAFGGSPAYLGGDEVIGRQLLCPVCLSPVYVCDDPPEEVL